MVALSAEALDDARDALRRAGRDADSFTFDFIAYPRLGCGAGPPVAEVVVTNATTGVRHIYPAGPRSNWLAQFAGHVADGMYGP